MTTKTKRSKKPTAKTAEKVLILRTCNADMTSHGGFVWPTSGPVKAPDWNPKAECGNGLHGWLWGSGDWRLQIGGRDRKWIVFEAASSDVIQLDGKVKVPEGDVLFVSKTWHEAMSFLRGRSGLVYESSATGDSGHASATGNFGWAVSNLGTAKAGADGILTIRYKNAAGKYRVAVGYVGEDGIKPNVAYRLTDDGKFEEASK